MLNYEKRKNYGEIWYNVKNQLGPHDLGAFRDKKNGKVWKNAIIFVFLPLIPVFRK